MHRLTPPYRAHLGFFLAFLLSVQALCVCHAQAQNTAALSSSDYPNRPIRLITPAPPGGSTDLLARIIGPRLSQSLKTPVVVDNRGGGGGVLAAEMTAHASPDGYTLLMAYSSHTTNVSLNPKANYRAVDDFQPVIHVTSAPLLLVTNANLPFNSAQDLVNYGKDNPGKLNFSSAGNGSGGHMAVELFKYMTKTNAQHIPYKGMGPSMVDLIAGNVQASFAGIVPVQPLLKAGRLRALCITASKRLSSLPNLPTISESGIPGYEVVTWYGILAPAHTPKKIIMQLNSEIKNILKQPSIEQRLSQEGASVIASTPEDFEQTLRQETQKWGTVVKATGARLD